MQEGVHYDVKKKKLYDNNGHERVHLGAESARQMRTVEEKSENPRKDVHNYWL